MSKELLNRQQAAKGPSTRVCKNQHAYVIEELVRSEKIAREIGIKIT